MADLTTQAKAKEWLRVTTADDDDLIDNIINRASAQIETICNREFNSASYTEWFDGNGAKDIYLDHWPVTAVTRVSSGRFNALGVWCNSTAATWASARVTSTGLTLIHKDTSGSSTNTLTFATYTTVTSLATAIDAVGSGWASLGLGYGDWLTTDLAQTPALYCHNQYAYLPHPYQALNDYGWEEDSGRLYRSGGFTRGVQNIYVEYTGGYTTIPFDVESACLTLISYMYNGTRRDPALKSEKLGDYAWTAADDSGESIYKELGTRLEKYKRITI